VGPLRVALIVVTGALVYANSLSGPFVFDDGSAIVDNPAIRSMRTVFAERYDSPIAGRPVVGYTFAMNYQLNGLDVAGYHVANIAIHIACALLLFAIARRTFLMPRLAERYGLDAPNLALAMSLLWVVHPLNTEAVNYITERTESLMAFFYLATLYASVRSLPDGSSRVWPIAAVVACALGMGCKESMASAPLIVVLYDRIFAFASLREALAKRWRLYLALATTWLVLAYLILPGPRSSSSGFSAGGDSWTYLVNQARMIARYLRLVFWPADLAIIYGPPTALTLGQVLPQALLVTALLVLTIAALAWNPALGFLGAWFFVTLAPASSVIPIVTEVGAERRMYLPLMAVIALLVGAAYQLNSVRHKISPQLATWMVGLMVAVLGAVTIARNQVYQSPLLLAQSNLAHWPSDAAHGAVGTELLGIRRDEEAIAELRLGARTNPRSMYNLGVGFFNNKRFDEALEVLAKLLAEYPNREEIPWARRIRGHIYVLQHNWPRAIGELRVGLSMIPRDKEMQTLLASALNGHGIDLGTAGKHAEAAAAFRRALEIDPASASVRHNLATALLDSGDFSGAIAEAQRNLEQHPADAGSYDLIGRALAMQGKLDQAIAQLEQALRLSPDEATIREDLLRVLAARRRQ
jgi:tetratricopeptide (TPR) repeat protein